MITKPVKDPERRKARKRKKAPKDPRQGLRLYAILRSQ